MRTIRGTKGIDVAHATRIDHSGDRDSGHTDSAARKLAMARGADAIKADTVAHTDGHDGDHGSSLRGAGSHTDGHADITKGPVTADGDSGNPEAPDTTGLDTPLTLQTREIDQSTVTTLEAPDNTGLDTPLTLQTREIDQSTVTTLEASDNTGLETVTTPTTLEAPDNNTEPETTTLSATDFDTIFIEDDEGDDTVLLTLSRSSGVGDNAAGDGTVLSDAGGDAAGEDDFADFAFASGLDASDDAEIAVTDTALTDGDHVTDTLVHDDDAQTGDLSVP